MKTITLVIMAVLIFGVATAPVFSGTAFAAPDENPKYTEKEKKEQRSDDSKQQKAKQNKKAEDAKVKDKKESGIEKKQNSKDKKEKSIDKKKISKEKHRANFEKKRAQLMEKYSNISDERKQKIQDRIAAMKEKRSDNQITAKEKLSGMSTQEIKAEIQKIRDQRQLEREERFNMTVQQKQQHLDELREKMLKQKEAGISPLVQMGVGIDPIDIVCGDQKELVFKITDGSPRCVSYGTAILLVDRGAVTYPDDTVDDTVVNSNGTSTQTE